MSDSSPATERPDGDAEVIDALPVLADRVSAAPGGPSPSRELVASNPRPLQAAAVAASGFLAGAAMAGLVHRRRQRRAVALSRRHRRRTVNGPVGELVQIVGSRSLLVDVHLLSGRD